MRLISHVVFAIAMITNQVIASVQVPFTESAKAAEAPAVVPSNYTLTINTSSPTALELKAVKGSFDNEVVAPLRAAQAQKAAADATAAAQVQAAANAARKATQTQTAVKTAPTVATGDVWMKLAYCEAGGRWTYNGSSGYDGAFQFSPSTWRSLGTGYEYAWQAPADVQIAAAQKLQARSGWGQWPSCARKLGLI